LNSPKLICESNNGLSQNNNVDQCRVCVCYQSALISVAVYLTGTKGGPVRDN